MDSNGNPENRKQADGKGWNILGREIWQRDFGVHGRNGGIEPETVKAQGSYSPCRSGQWLFRRRPSDRKGDRPDFFCWGYPFWDEVCVEVSKRIIDAAIRNNVILEINANGIRNCEKSHRYITVPSNEDAKKEIHCYAYPNIEFFKLCAETDALVMVNDDAHSPDNICDEDTIRAYEFAEKLGIKLVTKL